MVTVDKEIPWGEIGYITYKRTYARKLKEGREEKEEFSDTIERVIRASDKQLKVGFTEEEEEELRDIFLNLKASVAGRFLWQMGTKTVDKLGLLSLQNCAFTVVDHPIRPFTWAMDALMLGSGVGYSIQREFVYQIPKVQKKKIKIQRLDTNDADFIIPDTREGWVKLLGKVLKSYFYSGKGFTYSTVCVRGKGAPIKGFGGVSSGPEVLVEGINNICNVLDNRRGKKVRSIDCLDIMNIIGTIVVAGNVRRSAQIAIGDMDDLLFLNAKRWDKGNIPNWRALSNNSVVCNNILDLPEQFWNGYMGNGEPYGLINLDNARSFGRTGETEYPDLNVVGFNPCKPLSSLILTPEGYITFEQALERDVLKVITPSGEVKDASKPFKTGENRVITKVQLSDGTSLYGTENHRHRLRNGEWVELKDIDIGDSLKKAIPSSAKAFDETKNKFIPENKNRYNKGILCGWVYGDGWFSEDKEYKRQNFGVCFGNHEMDVVERFENLLEMKTVPHAQKPDTCRVFTSRNRKYGEMLLSEGMKPSNKKDLTWLYGKDESFKLGFLQALFTADGSVRKGNNVELYSINKDALEVVVRILQEFGIHSTLTIHSNACSYVAKDDKVRNNKTLFKVNVYAGQFKKIGFISNMKNEKLALQEETSFRMNDYLKVVDIDREYSVEDVYDITVYDEEHAFIDSGVVAHNCAEQSLNDKETCCLAEVFLPNITSKQEFFKVTEYLYRINKHSLRLPCHLEETEEIVHKNMRMGIGITGYAMATEEQKSWLDDTYKHLREYDKEYSEKMGWPTSIKLTTVKPSGTLSLLAGVSPGAHPGYSKYYIRRMRIASNSPLVDVCRSKGYNVEYQKNFDGTEDYSTFVVEFPCSFPENTVFANEVTAIDQLNIVKELQEKWSDNAVSVTVYYRKEEMEEIKEWLRENYNNNIKTLSFLLHSEHGFVQAPLEEISKEKYEEMVSKVEKITNIIVDEKDISEDQIGCVGGACPIK